MLKVGDILTLINEYGQHFHVIVAESSPYNSASLMVVYLSTSKGRFRDSTTIILPGEHKCVTKESWVRYQNIMIYTRKELEALMIKHEGQVNSDLLTRIQDGIMKTDRAEYRNKELLYHLKKQG